MTVDTTPTGIVYTVTNGNPGQEYTIVFPYIDETDVKARYLTPGAARNDTVDLAFGSEYSVFEQTLTSLIALPVDSSLAIYRETPLTQEILWVEGQAIHAPSIMKGDDKLTFIVQEMSQDVDRAIKISAEEEAGGSTPDGLLSDIFAARDQAQASASYAASCREDACGCAQNACTCAENAASSEHAAAEAQLAAEEARDQAAYYAGQAAMQTLPAATDMIRGGIRIGEGLEVTDTDKLKVAVPLPAPDIGDAGKILRAQPGGTAAWERVRAGVLPGEIRLLPFRSTELPDGWYFANGDRYALASPQGAALYALSTNYKDDWGIIIIADVSGTDTINVPKLFYTDGRGFFLRTADGLTRQPGSVQEGAFQEHGHYSDYMKPVGPVLHILAALKRVHKYYSEHKIFNYAAMA